LEILTLLVEVRKMGKKKANHVIPNANAAPAQGRGAGYNEEMANEPLTVNERLNNKKRKKNQ
jgi:small acid-soluble spore protein O (minor)